MPERIVRCIPRSTLAEEVESNGVSFKLMGPRSMTKRLRQFQKEFPERFMKALKAEAEIEATEAKKRTPVYVGPTGPGYPIPGLLRDSIHVEGPDKHGDVMSVKIVAGGAAGAYAIPQHENLEYFHEIGQAKY